MSVAELEESRSVRELQSIFKNGYNKKVNSEKSILECNQSFQKLQQSSQSASKYAQSFQCSQLNQQMSSIRNSDPLPKSLDDQMLIELKQSLNSLFTLCDSMKPNTLKALNVDIQSEYARNLLFNDEQFIFFTKEDERVAKLFEEAAEPIKAAQLQRVSLGEDIEKEKQRVTQSRKRIRNTIIALLLGAGGFLFALKENDPQLFEHYLNLVKGIVNK